MMNIRTHEQRPLPAGHCELGVLPHATHCLRKPINCILRWSGVRSWGVWVSIKCIQVKCFTHYRMQQSASGSDRCIFVFIKKMFHSNKNKNLLQMQWFWGRPCTVHLLRNYFRLFVCSHSIYVRAELSIWFRVGATPTRLRQLSRRWWREQRQRRRLVCRQLHHPFSTCVWSSCSEFPTILVPSAQR